MATNPFTPTFGVTPPLLVGRQDEIDDFRAGLQEGVGAPERITLVTGLRGTGKTVMLNAYEDVAKSEGWLVLSETAGKDVVDRLANTEIPNLLRTIEPNQTRSRITSLTMSGFGAQRTVTELNEPAANLRHRMNQLLDAIDPEVGVLISLDEIHRNEDLEILGSTIQHLRREDRNVAFVGAGLPSSMRDLLASDQSAMFLRRADRRHLGGIEADDVRTALQVPIVDAGRTITPEALDVAVEGTQGYPFMVQLVGLETWRAARDSEQIGVEHAQRGVDRAHRKMGQLVHEPALADLSATDRSFLAAMAQDPQGPSRMGDIAQRLGVDANYASQYRIRLIDAEIIGPVGHGAVDFTMPYLREHLQRDALPGLRGASFPGRPALGAGPSTPALGAGSGPRAARHRVGEIER
ncbi:ATP-binding protein [Microbacterium oryzae]|uniref:ATP-binding protein n=1 Tax=Microbacterium oryzae TaxID=743009 RepID=A0A6I6DT49_9MICO|nr:ATP-binding protein [Microbacterium oryzae]QGU28162.1 ATP-binding protein [Microbacterium oryzae]